MEMAFVAKTSASKGVDQVRRAREVVGWKFVAVMRMMGGEVETWLRVRLRSERWGWGSMNVLGCGINGMVERRVLRLRVVKTNNARMRRKRNIRLRRGGRW